MRIPRKGYNNLAQLHIYPLNYVRGILQKLPDAVN